MSSSPKPVPALLSSLFFTFQNLFLVFWRNKNFAFLAFFLRKTLFVRFFEPGLFFTVESITISFIPFEPFSPLGENAWFNFFPAENIWVKKSWCQNWELKKLPAFKWTAFVGRTKLVKSYLHCLFENNKALLWREYINRGPKHPKFASRPGQSSKNIQVRVDLKTRKKPHVDL